MRDGLNLVSKEYIACRNANSGVLILSEMAGASHELTHALKVHPYDTHQVKEAINYALSMGKQEKNKRMSQLRTQVFNHTIFDWVNNIFQEAFTLYDDLPYASEENLSSNLTDKLITQFKGADKRYILLDYDGCLRHIESHPQLAKPTTEIYQLLDKLMLLPNTDVYLVSGRSKADMDEWFGETSVNIIAEHGAWYKKHLGEWTDLRPDEPISKEVFLVFLKQFEQQIPGSFIEEKSTGYCLHFRGCKPKHISKYLDKLVNDFINFVKLHDLPYRFTVSPTQFEVLPQGCGKGKAVRSILTITENTFILAAGDDDTDEDMFEVLTKQLLHLRLVGKIPAQK